MRIVCLGDSLTAGFQSPTAEDAVGHETPYGRFLQEWLGPTIEVRVSGICGELTGEMLMRFRRDVLQHQPTHVVLLGGTNDLGWNARPEDIMRNLVKMYELARASGIVPVPVSVPSVRMEIDGAGPNAQAWFGQHLERRQVLNGLIRDYAVSKQLAWVDLFTATADPETEQLAAPYSNDGLHLTTAGYRLLARLLYDRVFTTAAPGDQAAATS
ncbi:MAG TPA: GDSL-type esterase/lipase family protein [Nitrospira sp.]|nr:GDSL-type esterase/lipase family protein [Nitrospira sp.]